MALLDPAQTSLPPHTTPPMAPKCGLEAMHTPALPSSSQKEQFERCSLASSLLYTQRNIKSNIPDSTFR